MPFRFAVAGLAVVLVVLLARSAAPRDPSSAELARVRAHIAGAERVIAQHTPAGLTAAQRHARAENLARLDAYRERGVFPHNRDFPGKRVPYFRDQAGVLCAMAHLIAASGRTDLVDLVAKTRNNATVLELAADPALGPALAAWLRDAGMTVAEAQRVQPGYSQLPSPSSTEETVNDFQRNSALLGAVSLSTIALNSELVGPKPSRGWSGALGFLTGGLQIALGADNLSQDSVVASLDMFVGGVAIITSISALARGPHEQAISVRTPSDGLHLSPLVGVGGGLEPQAGVSLSF